MDSNPQKLALVPLSDRVNAAEQLLVYEKAAAKILNISIHHFRDLVHQSLIPFRIHQGRTRRLYFVDDLRAYARSLEPHHGKKPERLVF